MQQKIYPNQVFYHNKDTLSTLLCESLVEHLRIELSTSSLSGKKDRPDRRAPNSFPFLSEGGALRPERLNFLAFGAYKKQIASFISVPTVGVEPTH